MNIKIPHHVPIQLEHPTTLPMVHGRPKKEKEKKQLNPTSNGDAQNKKRKTKS
jgi:hypothetical protein